MACTTTDDIDMIDLVELVSTPLSDDSASSMPTWLCSHHYSRVFVITRFLLKRHRIRPSARQSTSCTRCYHGSTGHTDHGIGESVPASERKIIGVKPSPTLRASNHGENEVSDVRPQDLDNTKDVRVQRMFGRERPKQKQDRFADFGFEPPYHRFGNKDSLAKKEKETPFGLTFSHNPYVHSLLGPVRECCFTRVKLPRSHLLDFHVAENEEAGGGLELLPLSMLAKMVPKKKALHKLTPQERSMLEEVDAEEQSLQPLGSASYVVPRWKALNFISEEDTGARLSKHVLNRRTKQTLAQEGAGKSLHWREDMADFVLESLQKLVIKRLRYFLHRKEVADAPGVLAATPGCRGLIGMDLVEKVSCVLRLTPSGPNQKTKHHEALDVQAPSPQETEILKNPIQSLEEDGDPVNYDVNSSTSEFQAEETSDCDEESETSDDAERNEVGSTKSSGATQTDPYRGKRSKTHKFRDGPWKEKESKSFLGNVHPLPSPSKPPSIYYPTMRYRNRRVPLYSLPQLLGEQNTNKLIRETVFKDIDYIAVTSHSGSVEPQIWLMKLQTYLAGSKAETAKV
ncbi:MAG: hypothetical protein M1831_006467 [Alyxoria varia]|nr:MAG: hypothetical protein M1831_006467 [Alyxoria varia]